MTNKKIYKLVILADEIRRSNLIEWSYFNRESLQPYEIIGNDIAAEILQGTLNMPVDRLAQEAIDENKKLLGLLSDNSVETLCACLVSQGKLGCARLLRSLCE